jgi:RDD family
VAILLIGDATGGFGNGFWLQLIISLPILSYQLACELFLNGQSLGKKAKNIRVISLDGNQPNIGQYLIRWIFRIVDDMISSGIVAIVTISLSQKAQRVGDILAGTTVVRINRRTRIEDTIFMDTIENYVPKFPQVTVLNDSDISLLKEVINRYVKDPNATAPLLHKAYDKTRALLRITNEYDPLQFLHDVVRDFNHLTSREV